MKLTRLQVLLIILCVVLCGYVYSPTASTFIKISRGLKKDDVSNELKRLKIDNVIDYNEWLIENFDYKNDDITGHWSTPEEMLYERTGDCEDYAFLNKRTLEYLGHSPIAIGMLSDDGIAHAICVFIYHNKWAIFDLDNLIVTDFIGAEGLQFLDHIRELYDTILMWEINND